MAKKIVDWKLGLRIWVLMKTTLFRLTMSSSVSANWNLMALKSGRLNRILTLTTIR